MFVAAEYPDERRYANDLSGPSSLPTLKYIKYLTIHLAVSRRKTTNCEQLYV